jgi:hypothetical protein
MYKLPQVFCSQWNYFGTIWMIFCVRRSGESTSESQGDGLNARFCFLVHLQTDMMTSQRLEDANSLMRERDRDREKVSAVLWDYKKRWKHSCLVTSHYRVVLTEHKDCQRSLFSMPEMQIDRFIHLNGYIFLLFQVDCTQPSSCFEPVFSQRWKTSWSTATLILFWANL